MRHSHNLHIAPLSEEALGLIDLADWDCSVKYIFHDAKRCAEKLANLVHDENFDIRELFHDDSSFFHDNIRDFFSDDFRRTSFLCLVC
jgi:hypothetical protein